MSSQQTTSAPTSIAVQADPPANADTPPVGSDISSLLTSGKSSGFLEIFFESTMTETISNVRLSLREDDEFAILAQAGINDRIFASIDVTADKTVKVAISFTGRPTHAVLSATFGGTVTARAKRVEN